MDPPRLASYAGGAFQESPDVRALADAVNDYAALNNQLPSEALKREGKRMALRAGRATLKSRFAKKFGRRFKRRHPRLVRGARRAVRGVEKYGPKVAREILQAPATAALLADAVGLPEVGALIGSQYARARGL